MKKLWIISIFVGLAALAGMAFGQDVVLKKVHHRGSVFPGFIEILEQPYSFGDLGEVRLLGEDKIETLVNIDEIVKLYRYEDSKKKDYASMMHIRSQKHPILVRAEYDDIVSMIKRASSHK